MTFQASNHQKISLGCLALLILLPNMSSAQSLVTVRYTKEELAAAAHQSFVHGSDLGDVLASKLTMLAVTLTSRQAGSNVAVRDVAASSQEISKSRYARGLATLTLDPDTASKRGDTDKLRMTLSQQSRKTGEVKFKDAFPIFERIRKGLTFRMDMAHSRSKDTATAVAPTIRYGLIETDIVANDSPISIASLGGIAEMDAGYSRPAKVVYTIDKLDSQENGRAFPASAPDFDPEVGLAAPQNTSMWTKAPSSKLDVTVDAADQNAAVSDSLGKGAAPAARVTVAQVDGFVTTQFATNDASHSRTTTLKAPLYGEMSIARKYDFKWHATETSALNVLGDSTLPRLNIVYAHKESKARGEWYVKKDRFDYTVTAEPRQGWGSGSQRGLGKAGDKISVGMNSKF